MELIEFNNVRLESKSESDTEVKAELNEEQSEKEKAFFVRKFGDLIGTLVYKNWDRLVSIDELEEYGYSRIILRSFIWEDTPERHDFWQTLCELYKHQ